jgi:hypothetical protein
MESSLFTVTRFTYVVPDTPEFRQFSPFTLPSVIGINKAKNMWNTCCNYNDTTWIKTAQSVSVIRDVIHVYATNTYAIRDS